MNAYESWSSLMLYKHVPRPMDDPFGVALILAESYI